MEHGFSWILAGQTAVPVAAALLAILLPGWLSHRWQRATAAKSARVARQLAPTSLGEGASP